MKRVGKGIYEIPGGVYYRAQEQRVESPAHLIVHLNSNTAHFHPREVNLESVIS